MCARSSIYPYHVIAAVDGSEHARAAISLLHDLPLPQGSRINVLAVLLPRNASDFAAFERVLAESEKILAAPNVHVETELLTGSPGEMLANYAEAYPPDLMVMGAKGLRATLGILLGGVAQQMIEYASWPVLIVRAPYAPIRRVLLTIDGSGYSQCAAEYLMRMPLPAGFEISILHVLPPGERPITAYQYFPHGAEMYVPMMPVTKADEIRFQAILEKEQREGQKLLDEYAELFKAAGFDPECVLRRGDAASEILQYAESAHADLMVTGSRGLGAMQGLLLGSVSRKLAHYGKCSILIVKGGTHGET